MSAHIAFLESNLFYEKGAHLLLQNSFIKSELQAKFDSLAEVEHQLDLKSIKPEDILHINNPLPFPHADSEIYYRRLYISQKTGVYYIELAKTKEKPIKVWDASTFDITASQLYTTIAFAAGSEGLFQQKVKTRQSEDEQKEPSLICRKHCTTCKWTDFNIYATSHVSDSFLATFSKTKIKDSKNKFIRTFDKVVSSNDIFHKQEDFSWGIQDKLYSVKDNSIDVIKYSSKKDGTPSYKSFGHIKLPECDGEVVSAEVAPFGTILEFENAIVVIQSNDETIVISGEPVSWRVFSKSRNYINQLHIIYEDCLKIFSFYNDYFVDQSTKKSGISMKKNEKYID